jgi:hypothetical protein
MPFLVALFFIGVEVLWGKDVFQSLARVMVISFLGACAAMALAEIVALAVATKALLFDRAARTPLNLFSFLAGVLAIPFAVVFYELFKHAI